MALTWKQSSADAPEADELAAEATSDKDTYRVRTLALSDPPGHAVVAWEGRDGTWEPWTFEDGRWRFKGEFSSAWEAKEAVTVVEKVQAPATATEKTVTQTQTQAETKAGADTRSTVISDHWTEIQTKMAELHALNETPLVTIHVLWHGLRQGQPPLTTQAREGEQADYLIARYTAMEDTTVIVEGAYVPPADPVADDSGAVKV